MKNNKKLKMIFDATILASGNTKSINRSGIYFVAFNILKEFYKSNRFKIVLYCENNNYENLKDVIAQYFPQANFDIITNKNISNKFLICEKLKKVKFYSREKHETLFKVLIQYFLNLLSIFTFFENVIHQFKLNKYQSYELFFSPVFKIPQSYEKIKQMRKYTILYDIIPIRFPNLVNIGPDSWYYKLMDSLNPEDYYFTDSVSARNDFLEYFPRIDSNKIVTTLLACDESFAPNTEKIALVKQKYNIPVNARYIYSLCSLHPRKNLIRNVKTFIEFIKKYNIDDLYFVIGGAAFDYFINELQKSIDNLGIYMNKILKIGYVSDKDLAPLYSGAEWFVYTSQYEGFGLPPLEAMSCGCPVITSNNSSLPEVVGDAGIMIDWDSDEQHIKAYEKYYFDKDYRNKMAKKGLERSKQFSWTKCANKMIEVMTK